MDRLQVLAKNLMLYRRNKEWWDSEVELGYKVSYYAHLALSYARFFATHNKQVRYLGHPFVYDNIAGPLNLQGYPKEVGNCILANLDKDAKLERVLDIGGNIGQFATTLKYFRPGVAIDIFEPNTNILPYLEANTKELSDVRIFPYALSAEEISEMYYEEGRSAVGSVLKDNAGNANHLEPTPIQSVGSVTELTQQSNYDLVKIDVEGYEFEALKCLKDIKAHYLFIEVSSGRTKTYRHSALYDLVRSQFGDFDIVYQAASHRKQDNFIVLLEMQQ